MKKYSNKGRLGVCLELKNNNYGSMLQSFATQKMLKDYALSYDLLSYQKKYTPVMVLKSLPRLLNQVVWQDKKNELVKKRFLQAHPQLQNSQKQRNDAFRKFREDYFQAPVVVFRGYDALQKGSRNYAAFLTGSDQLWSPSGLPTNFFNLQFTHEDALRISFASSFGVKEIPWYQKRRTKNYLNRIPFISCREQSGAEIVKKLTGREVPVVADPTMLYTGEEWAQMLPSKRIQEGKYIFSYFLGTNPSHRDAVAELGRELGLPVVSIHQFVDADLGFGDVEIQNAGPAEFVNLIQNAEYVCTDSFHGSVFSILFHKKFMVFNRYSEGSSTSKNTRIENLCTRLGLSDRRYSGNLPENIRSEIDYCGADTQLAAIREASRRYLERAFDAIKEV